MTNGPDDHKVLDSVQLEEIALLTDLVIAATMSKGRLSDAEVDDILGVKDREQGSGVPGQRAPT